MKKRTPNTRKKVSKKAPKRGRKKVSDRTSSSSKSFGYTVIAKPSKPSFSKNMIEKMMIAKPESE